MAEPSGGDEHVMDWQFDGTPVTIHQAISPFPTSRRRPFEEMADGEEPVGRQDPPETFRDDPAVAHAERTWAVRTFISLTTPVMQFCVEKGHNLAKRLKLATETVETAPPPRTPTRMSPRSARRARHDTQNLARRTHGASVRRSSKLPSTPRLPNSRATEQGGQNSSRSAQRQQEPHLIPGSYPVTPDTQPRSNQGEESPAQPEPYDLELPAFPGTYPASPVGLLEEWNDMAWNLGAYGVNISGLLQPFRRGPRGQAAIQNNQAAANQLQSELQNIPEDPRPSTDVFRSEPLPSPANLESGRASSGLAKIASVPVPSTPARRMLAEFDSIYNDFRPRHQISDQEAASAQLQRELDAAVQANLNRFRGPLTPPETPPPDTPKTSDVGMTDVDNIEAHTAQDAADSSDDNEIHSQSSIRLHTAPPTPKDDSLPVPLGEHSEPKTDADDLPADEATVSLVKEVETLQLSSKPDILSESGRRDDQRQTRKAEQELKAQLRRKEQEAEDEARRKEEEEELKAQRKKDYEELVQHEGILRVPQTQVVQPLSPENDAVVSEALKKGMQTQVALTVTGNPITRRDIGKVLPQPGTSDDQSGWLNDEVIQAYLDLVVAHGAKNKRSKIPKYHAFNAFFYSNLRTKGYDGVRRWAKKAKFGGKDLLDLEYVFVPVNQSGFHWTMAIISPNRKTIQYYDSLHGPSADVYAKLFTWLSGELGSAFKKEEWEILEQEGYKGRGRGPTQLNGSDCGVFAVSTAKMVMLGVDPMAVSGHDMPLQRRRVVAEILNGGFTGPYSPVLDFPEFE